MILHKLTLENFGVYNGTFEFTLTPSSKGQFRRSIILIRGKNGVGKTTLVEAIRLCLHGSLSVENRISLNTYHSYLQNRMHKNNGLSKQHSKICLDFEYVKSGKLIKYSVTRSWKTTKNGVTENLEIIEDNKKPNWLEKESYELFLRELVPPAALDLFFLDGEKLDKLTNIISNPEIMSESIKRLFGLHLSTQLSEDLDVFISRQETNEGHRDKINRIQEIHKKIEKNKHTRAETIIELTDTEKSISLFENSLQVKEQEIAEKGGEFVQDFDNLRLNKNEVLREIDKTKKEIQDLFSDLLPFAISPKLLGKVKTRLILERQYRDRKAAIKLFKNQEELIRNSVDDEGLWSLLGKRINSKKRELFVSEFQLLLSNSLPNIQATEDQIFIHYSVKDTNQILTWIDYARNILPELFTKKINKLDNLYKNLEIIEKDLARVPPKVTLTPLYSDLHLLQDNLSKSLKNKHDLEEQLSKLDYEKETLQFALANARDVFQSSVHVDRQVQLASKTQALLGEYSIVLLDKKLSKLEEEFVNRFNSLCRKTSFIDSINIDRDTFIVTLKRRNTSISHKELSAGETQIFAVAFIWALYNVAGLPLPIIFDTPLSRLDSDHRQKMLSEFFPKASHQTLLLTTDAEMDSKMTEEIKPAISHGYNFEFNEQTQTTSVSELEVT